MCPVFLRLRRRVLFVSLVAFLMVNCDRAAVAFVPDATPTYLFGWGSAGSLPGQFNSPFFVAIDAQGNVYVTDQYNHRVQKFDFMGNFILQWGTLGSGNGQFNVPLGIAIDASGNVYIADHLMNRVQKFDSNGNYLLQWGTAGTGNGQFSGPEGVAVDGAGNVYVGDLGNYRIEKFTSTGSYVTQWGSSGIGNGQFAAPAGIAIDDAGNVLVADSFNNRVERFSNTGTYLSQWGGSGTGNGQFNFAGAVAVDALGNIYVTDVNNNRVEKFDRTGAYLTQWGTTGSGNGQFNGPFGVGVDGAGNVYTTEFLGNRIQKFGGAGASASYSQAPLSYAQRIDNGLAFLPNGFTCTWDKMIVFTYDAVFALDFRTIPKWSWGLSGWHPLAVAHDGLTSNGPYIHVLATTSSQYGMFLLNQSGASVSSWSISATSPIGMAVAGSIYILDAGANPRVLKYNGSTFVTQWGSAGAGNGQFLYPTGIAADASGNVYVADFPSGPTIGRIQKFRSDGTFVAAWSVLRPLAIAVDRFGDVYTSSEHEILKYTDYGRLLSRTSIQFIADNLPMFLALNHGDDVFLWRCAGTNVIDRWITPPVITAISDVRNDQGHRVQVQFRGCSLEDMPEPLLNGSVSGYDVLVVGDFPGPTRMKPTSPSPAPSYMVNPNASASYSVTVATSVDATSASPWYSSIMVRAWTSFGPVDSYYDYGYAIDNIPLPMPAPFTAAFGSGTTHLHWGTNSAPDFTSFELYRGASASFSPGPASLVATTPDTGYADATAPGNWYKLAAVDEDGNVSAYATLAPSGVSGVPDSEPLAFALEDVRPNPANARNLTVHFTLPVTGAARMELLDVSGRAVVTREVGSLGVGVHTLNLADGRRLSAGLYFLRLTQGANTKMARVTLLK